MPEDRLVGAVVKEGEAEATLDNGARWQVCGKELLGEPADWKTYILGVLTAVVENEKHLDLFAGVS